jgi:hypothetical protein
MVNPNLHYITTYWQCKHNASMHPSEVLVLPVVMMVNKSQLGDKDWRL